MSARTAVAPAWNQNPPGEDRVGDRRRVSASEHPRLLALQPRFGRRVVHDCERSVQDGSWATRLGGRARDREARDEVRSRGRELHRDISAERQADNDGAPARFGLDQVRDESRGRSERERDGRRSAVTGEIGREAAELVRQFADLAVPLGTSQPRGVDEDDRRASAGLPRRANVSRGRGRAASRPRRAPPASCSPG